MYYRNRLIINRSKQNFSLSHLDGLAGTSYFQEEEEFDKTILFDLEKGREKLAAAVASLAAEAGRRAWERRDTDVISQNCMQPCRRAYAAEPRLCGRGCGHDEPTRGKEECRVQAKHKAQLIPHGKLGIMA